DYFKTEAIHWGWEFVTEVLKLDPERLYPTVFESDDEAFEIWEKEIGVPGSKIQRLGRKDNFWGPVGDRGPCGPCSEILYDQGPHIEDEEDRYLEIWNLVFPQFDAQPDGTFPELERKGIDTGAGLERIAAVMQGVDTNYETDLFRPYLEHLQNASGKRFGEDHETTCSMRVVADHCRATTFAIADKIVPSNVGRGYVLRRIMRRAMLHGQRLGLGQGFFAEMTPIVVEAMLDIYPDLPRAQEHVTKVVESEEDSFHRTLARGNAILRDLIDELKSENKTALSGEEAFRLYDTYGFPLELTLEVLKENGMSCSEEEFEEQMEEQRNRAKAAWKGSGMKGLAEAEGIESLRATDFVGYTDLTSESEVVYLFDGTSRVDSLPQGSEGSVVLDRTPFYAESGGQVGDIGKLNAGGGEFEVTDTQKSANGVFLHQGKVIKGDLKAGMTVNAEVDAENRRSTLPHHTGTHLLQAALQKVLGDHVHQQGSYVSPDNLRFDFSHTQGMTADEIDRVEGLVNQWVLEDYPVEIRHTTLDEAKSAGAMALFGEKYGEVVRMVSVEPVSRELCGGTHVNRTGEIGPFLVLGEESIQAGVRRITALAGQRAYQEIKNRESVLAHLAAQLKCPLGEVADRVEKLQAQIKEKDKMIKTLREQGAGISIDDLVKQSKTVKVDGEEASLVAAKVEAMDAETVETAVSRVMEKLSKGIVVLGAAIDGKAIFVCGVSKDLTGKVKAGDLAKKAATVVGGGGGGKPDWAKAGGKDPSKLDEAISQIEASLG
ncbi:MAG: alanine--tRNA ligase, partial [Candidatus Omnitrophica bacterium]|nr:alanine--tRNA ligase [Candidatus Omnitrophota bacterium]